MHRTFILKSFLLYFSLLSLFYPNISLSTHVIKDESEFQNYSSNTVYTFNNYGGSAVKGEDLKEVIEDLICRFIPFDTPIIDIGCGVGAHSQFMKSEGYKNVYAIDLSEKNIDYIAGNKDGICFVEGSFPSKEVLTKLPLKNWGCVLALNVFHFMEENQLKESLQIIFDRLRNPGFLIATFETKDSLLTLNPSFLEEHSELMSRYHYFKLSHFRKILEDIGYKIVQCTLEGYQGMAIVYKEYS